MATRSPIASNSDASSVAPATSLRCAASSTGKRNACGVWARNRPSRGTVATIRPSATSFSVSATGTAGIAPAACSRAASRAGMVPAGINGRAASCTSTTSGADASSASSPARTLSWRVAPPGTGGRCGRPFNRRFDRRRRRRPAVADRRGQPTPRRRGGSPVFRRATETASVSRRRIGCLTRRPPGSLLSACRHRCRPADRRQQRRRSTGALGSCHCERSKTISIAHGTAIEIAASLRS